MPAQQAPQRLQPPAGPADPVAERGAVQVDPLPGEDPGLAVQGQEIGVLGHQHVREQGFGRHPARDRPFGSRRLHHRLLAGPAGVAGAPDHLHPQLGRHDVEHLLPALADDVQGPAAAGAALVLDIEQQLDPRQVRRQGAQVASPDPGRPRGAVPCRHPVLRRLGGRCGLLEVLQAELELVGVELLRAPAELPTLELPDQEPQLLDLGLGRVTLGQDSIALDLESSASGALGGNCFRHMLQLQQQPLGVSRKVIQRQRHGAILLAESRERQDFRSAGRARARDRARLEPVPRQALDQGRELRARSSAPRPPAGDGQQNRPASSLFAYKTRPVPS